MVLAQVGTEQQGDLVLLADELDGGERLEREARAVVGEDRLEVRDRHAAADARELEVRLCPHALHRVEARGGAAARRDAVDEVLEAIDQRLLPDGADDLDDHLERERLVDLVQEVSQAAARPQRLERHPGAHAVLGVARTAPHLDDDRLGRRGPPRGEPVHRLVPHGVIGRGEILDERLEARAVADGRGVVVLGDLLGAPGDLLDRILLQAALQAPPRRGFEEGNQRERREPDLGLLLRIDQDLEDAPDRRLLAPLVELDEAVEGRDAHVTDLLPLHEPLERRDRLGAGEAREAARGDLPHAGFAVEEHRGDRLASTRILDEREQRHHVRAHAIARAFERFDERVHGVRSHDGELGARAIDLAGMAAAESPYEFGNFGCPRPKRHLK